jgi:hypothetical protein
MDGDLRVQQMDGELAGHEPGNFRGGHLGAAAQDLVRGAADVRCDDDVGQAEQLVPVTAMASPRPASALPKTPAGMYGSPTTRTRSGWAWLTDRRTSA